METVQRGPKLCGFRAVSRDLSDLACTKKKTARYGRMSTGGVWQYLVWNSAHPLPSPTQTPEILSSMYIAV